MTSKFAQEIQRVFLDQLNTEVPSANIDLMENGYLDSARFIDLLMILEREMNITIYFDQFEFDDFRTIEKIARFVENQVARPEMNARSA